MLKLGRYQPQKIQSSHLNCKNRGRRSCMLSGLLKKAGMASRNIVMKRQYTLLWFWIDRFQFLIFFHSARFAGEDALLNRRKSGKYKKYLCKLENTENSIFFSVKPNFKSDIQNIFNCLLHFLRTTNGSKIGLNGITFKFETWWVGTIFFFGLKNTWCAWKWCILGEWRIVSRPCCSYANLYFSTIISIRTQDQDKRGLYQNKVNLGLRLNWRLGY